MSYEGKGENPRRFWRRRCESERPLSVFRVVELTELSCAVRVSWSESEGTAGNR